MTDNSALIIVAAVTGIPAVITAVSTALLRRSQTKMVEAAADTKLELRAQGATIKETKDVVLAQTTAAVVVQEKLAETKIAVAEVHSLVNSQMTQMREDLATANARIADLIAKLPGRINGGHKE